MNSFGNNFRVTTWGESHGKALGCVIDGCPAGLKINEKYIEKELQRDVPIKEIGTGRKENNNFEILSGVFNGETLGTPISIIIYNNDVNSKPYQKTKHYLRPGHADFTYAKKYKYTDFRGGSRASGRECIARLAAGAVAKELLRTVLANFKISSNIIELAGVEINENNGLNKALDKVKKYGVSGDSTGGRIELKIAGIPAGIGNPVFEKLSAKLMYALSTIGGVKAVEIGEGIKSSRYTGSAFNDGFEIKNNKIKTITNHCGGILGGISTGDEIVIRISVKPTPTVFKKQHTVTKDYKEEIVQFSGRHDMNFTPRVCPVAENMAAIAITDLLITSGYISRDSLYNNNYSQKSKESGALL